MTQVFQVTMNSDTTEGRGFDINVGLFTQYTDAATAAKGLGPMGMSDGKITPVWLCNSIEEFRAAKKAVLAAAARARLTEDEREALGIE